MPETPEKTRRIARNLLLLLIPACLGAAAVFFLYQTYPDLDYWKGFFDEGREYLEAHPWALILVLATLPGLGFPLSPILILFGIVLVPLYGVTTTCLIGIAAQSVCSIWAYFLSAGPLRGILKTYVFRERELPQITERNGLRLAFILRITPGIPYALQNFALGVIGVRFETYLLASIPIQSLYTVGFIVTGGAIFEGRTGLAVTGLLLLIVAILGTRILQSRVKTNAG